MTHMAGRNSTSLESLATSCQRQFSSLWSAQKADWVKTTESLNLIKFCFAFDFHCGSKKGVWEINTNCSNWQNFVSKLWSLRVSCSVRRYWLSSCCHVVVSTCFNQLGSPWVAKKTISESPGTPKEIFIGTPVASPRGGASPLGWPWHERSEDKIRDSRAGVAIKQQVHGISLILGQNKTVLNSCFQILESKRKCLGPPAKGLV